jgi:hypothetical protein
MKRFNIYTWIIALLGIIQLQSCIIYDTDYGPDGRDGKAFFGIDYDYYQPYSYWDNNPSVPVNPFFGEFYRSYPGIYEFEYFINSNEYWYGTYEINIRRGEQGRPNGAAGRDGLDTYLRLICNPNGFYFESTNDCDCYRSVSDDGTIISEVNDKDHSFRIVMKKTTIEERPTYHLAKKQ